MYAGDGSMIIDRELDQKGKDENIGTSRVNLTQRYDGIRQIATVWGILPKNCVRKQTTGSALKRFSRKFI